MALAIVAAPVLGFAQDRNSSLPWAMGAPSAPPMEVRIGAFSPSDRIVERSNSSWSAQAAAPVAAIGTAFVKDYRVGPNDLIDIEVYDLDNSKRTFRVNSAGTITLPLIGPVIVGGLTAQEVEARIADRYREKYLQNPQVSIFIKEFATERLTVEGAVARPGMFPLTGQMTLLRALALAGGFGPIAKSSEVMLFRVNEQKVREVAVYDVEKIRAGKDEDPVIKGDDLIVVQRDTTRVLLKDSVFRDIVDSINPFSFITR